MNYLRLIISFCVLSNINLVAQDLPPGLLKLLDIPNEKIEVTNIPNVQNICDMVIADLSGLDAPEYYRYIWEQERDTEVLALCSMLLNSTVNKTNLNFAPNSENGPITYIYEGYLIRVNLFILAGGNVDKFKFLSETWDKFFNPYFLNENFEDIENYLNFPDRKFGLHINDDTVIDLQAIYANDYNLSIINPIVWSHTFINYVSIAHDQGLYYSFLGLRKANEEEKKNGLTDEDIWLAGLSLSKEIINKQSAEQRCLINRSGVTGKERRIDFIKRPAPPRILGLVTITQDRLDNARKNVENVLDNLIEFKSGGKEVLWELNNGHIGYVLFDGNGNLITEAPNNLVSDYTTKPGTTDRLFVSYSCIVCHAGQEEHGWKHIGTNDFKLLRNRIIDDLNAKNSLEAINQILEYYDGFDSLNDVLDRARLDQSNVIVKSLGGITHPDETFYQMVDVGRILKESRDFYEDTYLTQVDICRELGYHVNSNDDAKILLKKLLVVNKENNFFETASIIYARENESGVSRINWESVYQAAYILAKQNEAKLTK